jgi:broad specificity phosphatase PhoE
VALESGWHAGALTAARPLPSATAAQVPLTAAGWRQALAAGEALRALVDADPSPARLFFYTSPYARSRQTFEGIAQAFDADTEILGVQEEVQLREQDFGNFQDAEGKRREKAERLRYGRFFYRFPNGESGADVYDRMTLFEDHLVGRWLGTGWDLKDPFFATQ